MANMINIGGLDRALLLVTLFNNAAPPIGMSKLQGSASDVLTYDEAVVVLNGATTATPYLGMPHKISHVKGRWIRIDLSFDLVDPTEYDAINGDGAAKAIISALRNSHR